MTKFTKEQLQVLEKEVERVLPESYLEQIGGVFNDLDKQYRRINQLYRVDVNDLHEKFPELTEYFLKKVSRME